MKFLLGLSRYFLSLLITSLIFSIILSITAFSQPSPSPPPCPPGMVAYWRAEGNASDYIGNYDGILMNGTTFAPGICGQAFSLDGVDDYVDVGDLGFSGNDPRTVEMWFSANVDETEQGVFASLFSMSEEGVGWSRSSLSLW